MNDMIDMGQFVEAKSDQLTADDLIGAPRTITITRVTGNDGDQPINIHYEGDGGKPFRPCKTIRRILLAVWGRNGADYVGRSMTLYRDDGVTFGGLQVGGIRISHMSHIDKEMVVVVMKTKGKKAGIKVLPLKTEPKGDPAKDWADKFIADIRAAEDRVALEKLAEDGAKALARLEKQRPELHTACADTLQARREFFAADGAADEQRDGSPDWPDAE